MKQYTFSIEHDTLNGKVDSDALTIQIQASPITIALSRIDTSGDVLDIYFKIELSTEEQTTLHSVVAAHDGIPPTPPSEVVVTTPANNYMMQRNGVMSDITPGTTTMISFKIENYEGESFQVKYLWGADFMCKGGTFGDWAKFSIMDMDNVLGYGEGVVVKEYVKKKYIFPDIQMVCSAFAPGAVPIGLYLCCEYHSVGATGTTPQMALNYHIELKDV